MAPANLHGIEPIDLTLDTDEELDTAAQRPLHCQPTYKPHFSSGQKTHSHPSKPRHVIILDSDDDAPTEPKKPHSISTQSSISMPMRQRESVGLDQSVPRKRAKLEIHSPSEQTRTTITPDTEISVVRDQLSRKSSLKVSEDRVSNSGRGSKGLSPSTPANLAAAPFKIATSETSGLTSVLNQLKVPAMTKPDASPREPEGATKSKHQTLLQRLVPFAIPAPPRFPGLAVRRDSHAPKIYTITSQALEPVATRAESVFGSATEHGTKEIVATAATEATAGQIDSSSEQDEVSRQLHEETNASQGAGKLNVPPESVELPDESQLQAYVQLPLFVSTSPVPVDKTMEYVLTHQLHALKADTIHSTRHQLRRARLAAQVKPIIASRIAANIFAKLKPRRSRQVSSKTDVEEGLIIQVESWTKSNKKSLVIDWLEYSFNHKKGVPKYSHCVRLQGSILAPNITMLNVWPYFGDEGEPDESNFKRLYAVDVKERQAKLQQLHLAQWLFESTESALGEANLSWSDILACLFCERKSMPEHAHVRQADLVGKDFPASSARWLGCSQGIGTQDNLAKALHFCLAFQRLTGLSIWHVLRRSEPIRDYFSETRQISGDLWKRECRICYRFDCCIHGQIKERPDNDTESGDSGSSSDSSSEYSDDPDTRDIVNPAQANFRRRMCFELSSPTDNKIFVQNQTVRYWETKDQGGKAYKKPNDMNPFVPCHHPGQACDQAQCSCFKASVPCEKYCTCPPACSRKFQGCTCKKGAGKVCFLDNQCACYVMGRECNPDLCGSCGVDEVLDTSRSLSGLPKRCGNASLQRGIPKHTLLGDSTVHELGLFACEQILSDQFIGEYKGEVLPVREADRRGAIYEYQKLSYLFTLNDKQEVDATYCGNKIRFINHDTGDLMNAHAMIMLVDTVHRIGLWASRDIAPGEELFFNYGENFPEEHLGGTKSSKAVPQARNMANVTNATRPKPAAKPQKKKQKARKSYGNVGHGKNILPGDRLAAYYTDSYAGDAGDEGDSED